MRDTQIKTTLKFCLIPVREAVIKKRENVGQDIRRNLYILLVEMLISSATMEISIEVPQQTKNKQ